MRALVIAALLAAGCGGCLVAIEGEPFTLLDEPAPPAPTVFVQVGAPVYPTGEVTVEMPKVPRTRPADGGAP